MPKKILEKMFHGARAASALELSIGSMALISIIGVIVSQGWGFAFSVHNNYRSWREAAELSYRYSRGEFKPGQSGIEAYFSPDEDTGESGSRSRAPATIMAVWDYKAVGMPGKYGTLNRTAHMFQKMAFHTDNLYLPIAKDEDRNLPRLDVYVNGVHIPLKTAGFRTVDLSWESNNGNPFWEPYCLYATQFPLVPHPDLPGKKAFAVWDWNGYDYTYEVLTHPKYENAPWVGCMQMWVSEGNTVHNNVALRYCYGSGIYQCEDVCENDRFDLDRMPPHVGHEIGRDVELFETMGYAAPIGACNGTSHVPDNVKPVFSRQWSPVLAVLDEREDSNSANNAGEMNIDPAVLGGAAYFGAFKQYQSLVSVKVRYGRPMKNKDYVDFPCGGGYHLCDGEKQIQGGPGDRDLTEEQVVEITQLDPLFNIVERVILMDSQNGDINFSSIDDEEVGFYYGNAQPGQDPTEIVTKSPTRIYSQVKDGTFMSVKDLDSQVVTTRIKKAAHMVERVIKLSKADTARWCNTPTVDGEPNPIKECYGCDGQANQHVSCFDPGKKMMFIRTIIDDQMGLKWTVDK